MTRSRVYVVVKEYKSNYPDPIILRKGEKVRLGEAYDGPEDWPGWLFCYKPDASHGGWVPEQLIIKDGTYGLLKENYSAAELDVVTGERLRAVNELNGWVWCIDEAGAEGWVPKNCLEVNGCK